MNMSVYCMYGQSGGGKEDETNYESKSRAYKSAPFKLAVRFNHTEYILAYDHAFSGSDRGPAEQCTCTNCAVEESLLWYSPSCLWGTWP